MATTPEGKVKKKVKETLATMGAYYVMPVTGGFGNSGIPDIVGCIRGRFFAIECKAGNGKTTALQDLELNRIHNAGGTTYIARESNLDELQQILREKARGL